MNASPNTLCRIVGFTAAPFNENNNRIVVTSTYNEECAMWHITMLQTLAGLKYGRKEFPPGSKALIADRNLRPLGDEGKEESDLFKAPKEVART